MNYIAEPMKRVELRTIARFIREKAGYKHKLHFPIMLFLEHHMPLLFKGFHYEIVPKSYFPPAIHAETDVENHVIRIREDVYLGAINEEGRDRMTIAHEIAHYILIVVNGIKLYRTFSNAPLEAFRDPEWQAKALAGEIMCPYDLVRNMPAYQIQEKCGVSEQAAGYTAKICGGKGDRF
jgi:Zn-dependent peptidase ImmA (M78 family)